MKFLSRIIIILSIKLLSSKYSENRDDFLSIIHVSSFTLTSIPSLKRIYRKRQGQQPKEQNQTRKRWKKGKKLDSSALKPKFNETVTIDFSQFSALNDDGREMYVHHKLMDKALNQAREAGKAGEVPIGAVVVIAKDGENEIQHKTDMEGKNGHDKKRQFIILSNGQNQIETIHDASAHAELQALRSASNNIQNWRLINATLYTTLEPCPMCLSAAQAFRISKIVYGAPDLRLGAIETHINLLDVATHPFHDTMEVVGGVKSEECGQLLKDFFRERRKQAKKRKQREKESESNSNCADNNDEDSLDKLGDKSIFNNLFNRLFLRIRHKLNRL